MQTTWCELKFVFEYLEWYEDNFNNMIILTIYFDNMKANQITKVTDDLKSHNVQYTKVYYHHVGCFGADGRCHRKHCHTTKLIYRTMIPTVRFMN